MMIGQAGSFNAELSWGRLTGLQTSGSGSINPTLPVLALHGWLDNAASFSPLMALSRRSWLALEFAGHGHSDHRAAGNFGPFLDHVIDLLEVFTARNLAQVDLVGHSMGGAVAVLFAAAFPERVRSLVMLESLGPLAHGETRFVAELRRAAEERLAYSDRRRVYADLSQPIAARAARGDISAAAAALLMERGCETVPGGVRFRTDPRHLLPSPTRGTEAQMQQAIAALRCPTLAVLANPRTSYLAGAAMDARRADWPKFQEVLLDGGHHLHMDQAEKVLPLLEAFWARIDRDTTAL